MNRRRPNALTAGQRAILTASAMVTVAAAAIWLLVGRGPGHALTQRPLDVQAPADPSTGTARGNPLPSPVRTTPRAPARPVAPAGPAAGQDTARPPARGPRGSATPVPASTPE